MTPSDTPEYRTRYSRIARQRLKANGGKHTAAEWRELLDRFDGRCACCGRGDVPIEKDHVIPVVLGGSNSIENLQPLCGGCNRRKSRRIVDYRTLFRTALPGRCG